MSNYMPVKISHNLIVIRPATVAARQLPAAGCQERMAGDIVHQHSCKCAPGTEEVAQRTRLSSAEVAGAVEELFIQKLQSSQRRWRHRLRDRHGAQPLSTKSTTNITRLATHHGAK